MAWDPWGTGKTVIRAGAGLYYENAIFNNVLFDRPARLTSGLFFGTRPGLLPGVGDSSGRVLSTQSTRATTPDFCGASIGVSRQRYRGVPAAISGGGHRGRSAGQRRLRRQHAGGRTGTQRETNSSDRITVHPRSVQINGGIQHQFGHGTVLTADYVRNVSTHYLIGLDTNKQGDARFLNVANAQNAISTTNAQFGCGTGFGAASIDCSISKGASIVDFAGNGLDSGALVCQRMPVPRLAHSRALIRTSAKTTCCSRSAARFTTACWWS